MPNRSWDSDYERERDDVAGEGPECCADDFVVRMATHEAQAARAKYEAGITHERQALHRLSQHVAYSDSFHLAALAVVGTIRREEPVMSEEELVARTVQALAVTRTPCRLWNVNRPDLGVWTPRHSLDAVEQAAVRRAVSLVLAHSADVQATRERAA